MTFPSPNNILCIKGDLSNTLISLLDLRRPKEICQIQNEWLTMASIWCSYYCPCPLPCYWAIISSPMYVVNRNINIPKNFFFLVDVELLSLNSLLQICDLTKQALITYTKCFIASITTFTHNQESSLLACTPILYTNILTVDVHFLMAIILKLWQHLSFTQSMHYKWRYS
jgi:hypothetical protein